MLIGAVYIERSLPIETSSLKSPHNCFLYYEVAIDLDFQIVIMLKMLMCEIKDLKWTLQFPHTSSRAPLNKEDIVYSINLQGVGSCFTEKTIVTFPFTLNGI